MLPLYHYPLLSVDELALWSAAVGALILGAKNCLGRRRFATPRAPLVSSHAERAE